MASDLSKDIVQIIISCGNNKKIPFWNIYNAPTGSNNAGESLSTLLRCIDIPYFVCGDFNLRHPSWDSSTSSISSSSSDLIDWYENKGLKLLNPMGIPTHNRGGTIDLAFCLDESARCEFVLTYILRLTMRHLSRPCAGTFVPHRLLNYDIKI